MRMLIYCPIQFIQIIKGKSRFYFWEWESISFGSCVLLVIGQTTQVICMIVAIVDIWHLGCQIVFV